MIRKFVCALIASAAILSWTPAKADVVYNITFYDDFSFTTVQGTGAMTLNFSAVSQTFNYNNSLAPILVGITTTNLNGHGTFSFSTLNGSGFLGTGPTGNINSLTAAEGGSGAASVLFLDLFTNSWQIHTSNAFGAQIDDGAFKISGPSLVTVPGPIVGAGLPGLLAAAGALVALARRRRVKAFV